MSRFCNSLTFVGIILCIQLSLQISVEEFLTLSLEQKAKLDEFRERMIDLVPHDYMKQEIYLIRWLRDRDFDVDAAQEQLLKHISWRDESRMDSITTEDFEEMNYEFKVNIEGCSRESHVIITMRAGDWDVRKYVLAGKGQKAMRFVDKMFEEGEILIRAMQDDGQNTTQMTMILDVKNFNLIQQGCARCLPIYFHVLRTYDNHFVGFAHRIIAVNTPEIAIPIFEVLKTVMRKPTRDLFTIYGNNKAEWSSILLKEINQNQLTRSFGGTKREALDMQDLRPLGSGGVYKCENSWA